MFQSHRTLGKDPHPWVPQRLHGAGLGAEREEQRGTHKLGLDSVPLRLKVTSLLL